jgi:hypothetical protein
MTFTPVINRPFRVILLVLLIVCAAGSNGFRLGEAIFFWKTLVEYGAHPLYISLSGGFWLNFGLFTGWGLLFGKKWSRMVAMLGTAGYLSWYWLDRLVLQGQHSNWLFTLFADIFFVIVIIFILFSQKTRLFIQRDNYGRKSETTTST